MAVARRFPASTSLVRFFSRSVSRFSRLRDDLKSRTSSTTASSIPRRVESIASSSVMRADPRVLKSTQMVQSASLRPSWLLLRWSRRAYRVSDDITEWEDGKLYSRARSAQIIAPTLDYHSSIPLRIDLTSARFRACPAFAAVSF